MLHNRLSSPPDARNTAPSAEASPMYMQVSQDIRKNMLQQYQAGDYLPSEKQLAERYQVNRHTVRRALDELVVKGLVQRHQGKGTKVLERNKIRYALQVGKFTAGLAKNHHLADSELLSAKLVDTPEAVLALMFGNGKTNDGEPQHAAPTQVAELQTKRYVDGAAITLIYHYINPTLAPDIHTLYRGGSLHAALREHYQLNLERTHAQISSSLPSPHEAYTLGIHPTLPLLRVQSINALKDNRDQVVEVSFSCSRSDQLDILVEY